MHYPQKLTKVNNGYLFSLLLISISLEIPDGRLLDNLAHELSWLTGFAWDAKTGFWITDLLSGFLVHFYKSQGNNCRE